MTTPMDSTPSSDFAEADYARDRAMKSRKRRRLFLPLLLLGIAAAGYTALAIGTSVTRTVWVVNGLDVPYEVTIGGRSCTLPAGAVRPFRSGEGSFEIASVTPGVDFGPLTAEIRTSFFTRLFRRSFVLNPDRNAAILWEQTVYSSRSSGGGSVDPYQIHVNKLVQSFTGIDFAFEPFPAEIEMSRSTGSVKRERISLLNIEVDDDSLSQLILSEVGTDAAVEFVERRLTYDPSRVTDIYLLAAVLGAEFETVARSHLAVRPARVDWHRAYQEQMRDLDDVDLEKVYRDNLAQAPDDSALQYLLGRVVDDPAEADQLFQQARRGNPPSAHAADAIAYAALVRGDFETAMTSSSDAIRIARDSISDDAPDLFSTVHYEALHAQEKFEFLLQDAVTERNKYPGDYESVAAEVYLLVRLGRKAEVDALIEANGNALASLDASREEIAWTEASMQALIATAEDDVHTFLEIADAHPELNLASDAALLRGDIPAATAALERFSASIQEYLLVFAGALLQGEDDLAAALLAEAVALAPDAGESRAWSEVVAWLSDETPPPAVDVDALRLLPDDKRTALVALGAHFADERERLWSLAETLNYTRTWPYLSVRKLLQQ